MSSLVAAGGATGMGAATASLWASTRSGLGGDALISGVLVVLAGSGILLCLYLTIIWGLAALVLLAGPASRSGTALLTALRVLAPRLAQRITTGAAVATTATALVLTPALATESMAAPAPAAMATSTAPTAQLLAPEDAASDPSPTSSAAAGADVSDSSGSEAPLPPLGWSESAPPAPDGSGNAGGTDPGPSSASSKTAGADSAPAMPLTVVVHQGDSLWSITDDLLGPGPSDASEIAVTWPLLHEANRDLIGPDPDLLIPGQQLSVPSALTTQDLP